MKSAAFLIGLIALSGNYYNQRLFELTNQERATPLIESSQLDQLAQARAEYVCNQPFTEKVHTGFDIFFSSTSFQWTGENLAQNFTDASDTNSAFMASPTHHANIVNTKYSYIGIGHVANCPTNPYGNKNITVEFFGGYAS